MNKKIIGIFVCMLLIAAVVLPTTGTLNKMENEKFVLFKDNTSMEFVPGEFIVKLKKDATFSRSSFEALNEKYQVYFYENVFPNSKGTVLDNIYILYVPMSFDILSVVEEYKSFPDVVYAEPNSIVYLCGIPNDVNFNIQWSLHNTGQIFFNDISGIPDADIDAPEAWDIETGNPDVIIAIPDTGIDYTHPDLAANIWNNQDEIPENSIDDDNNGYIDDIRGWDFSDNDNDPKDEYGHGTLCAGVAAAVSDNNIGIAGVSWNCKIMPVKIFNKNYQSTMNGIAAGIKYAADNGANVISMSFGSYPGSSILLDAVNYAYNKGIFLCAGVGNDNKSNKFYPAAYENVTAVAATNQNDERCTKQDWDPNNYVPGQMLGSNYGDWVDIAAPGSLLYSTMPTYHVTFNDILHPLTGQKHSQNYEWFVGTSSSTPFVAGVAAQLLSRDPSLTPDEIKTLICENVDPYDSEYYIGTGRINAYKALIACNTAPEKPTITGETNGKSGTEYEYTFVSTDPEEDEISYYIDWGDNTNTGWTRTLPSGDVYNSSHIWSEKGNFTIQAKAKDSYGAESNWATLIVSITKSKVKTIDTFILRFLEKYPILYQILQRFQS